MRPTKIRLADVGSIDGIPNNHELVTVSLGVDGVVTSMWVASDSPAALLSRERYPASATVAIAYQALPTQVIVAVTSDEGTETLDIDNLTLAFPYLARLSHSRDIVIAAKRCSMDDGAAEKNAIRMSPAGQVVATGTLGDGIQYMVATPDDALWVGYFDEGVFGNNGWGGPSGPAPMGEPGIVRFSGDFQVKWRYPQENAPFIADCYTLTVSGGDAYACPYTDFPIVRIREGVVESWKDLGRPAQHMLVAGNRVALLGGYSSQWSQGTVVDLDTGIVGQLQIAAPRGVNLKKPTAISAVGDTILALQGTRILKGALEPNV